MKESAKVAVEVANKCSGKKGEESCHWHRAKQDHMKEA